MVGLDGIPQPRGPACPPTFLVCLLKLNSCHDSRRRSFGSRCLPTIQYFIHTLRNCTPRVGSLPTSAEQLVIVRFVVSDVRDYGEAHGVFIHFLCQVRTSNAATVFQTGMFGDLLFSASRQPWKNFANPGGEPIDEGFVEFCSPFGFSLSAPRSQIGVSETLVFR